jgi:localization factor PodJL
MQTIGSAIGDLPADTTPELLRQAAAAGDPAAEFEVAVRFMDGRGLPQDASKAVEWYRKAAAQGLAPAQYRLGSLYEKGEGVERDLSMARMWYQRAAEQGNRKAMHNLAVLYADGIDGKPDYEKAATWFNQAAEYGLADSQFNLAVLFARGLGVQTDFAADHGDTEALLKRDEIAQQLDQETLMKARAALDAWQPKPTVASANVVPEPQGGWGEVKPARQAFIDRDMIMTAQSMLSKLGYTPGPADGEIGPRTRDAVRAFQRSVGMRDTGDITPELLQKLDKTDS